MIKSDDFENMIKLYPVNYKGYWFNVDEIDNPLPQELLSGDGRIDAEIKEQFTQQFYNQIIYAYIYITCSSFYTIMAFTVLSNTLMHCAKQKTMLGNYMKGKIMIKG